MTAPETLVLVAYFFVLSILGIYGWHRYYLVYQYMKNKDRKPGPPPEVSDEDLPLVTIQLPIYNEMYVVDRLVDSVCRIDYPREKLQIQILDDSTDETCDTTTTLRRGNAPSHSSSSTFPGSFARARFDVRAHTTTVVTRE